VRAALETSTCCLYRRAGGLVILSDRGSAGEPLGAGNKKTLSGLCWQNARRTALTRLVQRD
jgi:hypothetical protein